MKTTQLPPADAGTDRNFIFYASYGRAILNLPQKIQLEIFRALTLYGNMGIMPGGLSPVAEAIFMLIKPQIDANTTRYENNRRGAGGPPKGSHNNPNGRRGKQPGTQPATEPEQTSQPQPVAETPQEPQPQPQPSSKLVEVHPVAPAPEPEPTPTQAQLLARARQTFKDDFFQPDRLNAISRQASDLGISIDRYRELVDKVLDDWEVNGPVPGPDNDSRTHMIFTVRKKCLALARTGSFKAKASTAAGRESFARAREQERRERAEVLDRQPLTPEQIAAKFDKWRPFNDPGKQEAATSA